MAGHEGMSEHLHTSGIFALWSNNLPDAIYTERLSGVFAEAWPEPVTFYTPYQSKPAVETV